MSTHSLKLQKFSGSPGNKVAVPSVPVAYVALKSYIPHKTLNKPGGKEVCFRAISSMCVSFNEIDWEVNRLIEELQTIRKQARGFFQKEQSKRQAKRRED